MVVAMYEPPVERKEKNDLCATDLVMDIASGVPGLPLSKVHTHHPLRMPFKISIRVKNSFMHNKDERLSFCR